MTNKVTLYVGKPVSFLTKTAAGPWKWTARKVATVVDQDTVTLVGETGSKAKGRASSNWRAL